MNIKSRLIGSAAAMIFATSAAFAMNTAEPPGLDTAVAEMGYVMPVIVAASSDVTTTSEIVAVAIAPQDRTDSVQGAEPQASVVVDTVVASLLLKPTSITVIVDASDLFVTSDEALIAADITDPITVSTSYDARGGSKNSAILTTVAWPILTAGAEQAFIVLTSAEFGLGHSTFNLSANGAHVPQAFVTQGVVS